MRKSCSVCGEGFEAKSARRRYCSDRCRQRKRAHPDLVAAVVAGAPVPVAPGPIEVAVGRELADADRAQAAAVTAVAQKMDRYPASESGSGLAALSRELQAGLRRALADRRPPDVDPLDELRRRRELKKV